MEAGLTRIHSPSSRLGYLLAGLVGLLFTVALVLWQIAVSLSAVQSEAGGAAASAPADAAVPWGPVILALLLSIPMHELVHAIWHPKLGLSSQTVMVIWPTKLRFGVYYEGCMTRRRWLAMRLAPFVCLSVIPVLLLTLLMVVPASFALETFLQVLFLVNGIGSGGDVIAVLWVLFQAPARSQICFCNGKAYWRQPPRPNEVAVF